MRACGFGSNALRVGAAVLGLTVLRATSQQVTVNKTATDTNPRLAVTAFIGPDAVKTRFEATLRRANWFKLVPSGSPAEYTLAARDTPGRQEIIDMTVEDRNGASVSLRRVMPGGHTNKLIYAAVDALIKKVFGVPGPCSEPIAFVLSGRGGEKEIYSCNFDGTGVKRLTHNGTISTEPSWGLGGRYLVYTLYQHDATCVVLMDMLFGRQRLLSRQPGLNSGAELSPDGRWAALCLSRDQRIELYRVSVATGQLYRLTDDLATESSPCWSPRGTRICYVSNRAGNPQLYVMPSSGGPSERVLAEHDETVSPDWSPVSNRICFSTLLGGQYVIGYVDMSDPEHKRVIVTRAAGDWNAPSWAPDGRHLVCSRDYHGRQDLYMVDTWQRRLIQMTQGGICTLPCWCR